MDWSALVDEISFAGVGPAVLPAAAAVIGLYLIGLGVRVILALVWGRRYRSGSSSGASSHMSPYARAHMEGDDFGPKSEAEWERTRRY